MKQITKPKLVFFNCRHDENLPKFLILHKQQQIKCLSEFFEVINISQDCDYQQICDQYQPEITLFENCGNNLNYHRLNIKNTSAYSNIPKLGLHNADPWCNSRAVFISDMEKWGIQTFFSIATTTAEHTPEIADNLFVWPNFIDADIYRDYSESKIIPMLLTGANHNLYCWRQKIHKIVSQYYPSLVCPHLGYSGDSTLRMMYGEQYARTINASWFVPTCGSVAKEVVRKHFEIPGAKACLITEKSPSLEAAGFIDMQNCVFVNEHDLLDKLDYLLKHQDELESIINAGYQLVHSQHTLKQRDQIFHWFNLYKNLKPHQTIIQTNPFEPLIVVEKSSGMRSSHIICNGLNIVLLRQGDEKLRAGRYEEAEEFYFKCLNYVSIMHEPKLRLALCNLYKGNAETAIEWIVPMIQCTLNIYKASDPEPVEWAYFIISLLCLGKLDEATKRSDQFPALNHTELNYTRWAINVIKNRAYQDQNILLHRNKSQFRASIHNLPNRNLNNWIENLCKMLIKCGQVRFAEILKKKVALESQILEISEKALNRHEKVYSQDSKITESILSKASSTILKATNVSNYRIPIFTKKIFFTKLKRKLTKMLHILHPLEYLFDYFLPYQFSDMKNDEFFGAIHKLTMAEDIRTGLIIGASAGKGSTEAFLAGILGNQNKSIVFCINNSIPRFIKLQKQYHNDSVVKCYPVPSASLEDLPEVLNKNKQEKKIDCFDVVLIDNHELSISGELDKELYGAKIFIFDNINTLNGYKQYHRFLTDSNYIIESQNSGLRHGYAIFRKSKIVNNNS